jgi:hypothetical protein
MTAGPTSDSYLGEALHNNPKAYWCPHCWSFTLDCIHLVTPLDAPSVQLNDWLIKRVAHDSQRRIRKLEMNAHESDYSTSVCRAKLQDACEMRIAYRISERANRWQVSIQTSANRAARNSSLGPHLFKQFVAR